MFRVCLSICGVREYHVYVVISSSMLHPFKGYFLFPHMSDICGGKYNVIESRIITTPGYPSPYAANLNCTWTVIAPPGHYLTASFLEVDIASANNNCTTTDGLLTVRNLNATGELLEVAHTAFLHLVFLIWSFASTYQIWNVSSQDSLRTIL